MQTITVADAADASMVDTISVIVAAPSDEGDDEDDVGQALDSAGDWTGVVSCGLRLPYR